MYRGTSVSSNEDIRQWWKHLKARNQVFFHLMSDDAPALDDLQNLRGFILQLDMMYRLIEAEVTPERAQKIQTYLLKAIQNLKEGLEKAQGNQLLESEIRLDSAKVDYSVVQSELLKRGISA